MKLPTYNEIKPYLGKKLISEQRHPEFPELAIFNYTHRCQFEKAWDEVTTQCRGLILNTATSEVVARPFPKFFNMTEHTIEGGKPMPIELGEEPFIYEKYDGSLGILYYINDKPFIATRGSFVSEQALWATKWWQETIKDRWITNRNHTHLFEIIYPGNRIVVNYNFEGLVYLATVDIHTGLSWVEDMSVYPIRSPKQIDHDDWNSLDKLAEDNKEGFVIFFPNSNFRVKVKFDEYVRLHKILTGMSEKGVWEWMKEHGHDADITAMAEDAPDEFYEWLKGIAEGLATEYLLIHVGAEHKFDRIKHLTNRKEFAKEAVKSKYAPYLFALLDGKNIDQLIWKAIRPRATKVFKQDIDA